MTKDASVQVHNVAANLMYLYLYKCTEKRERTTGRTRVSGEFWVWFELKTTAGDLRIIVFCYKFPFYFWMQKYILLFLSEYIFSHLFTTTTFLIIKCLCYLYASILTARVYTTYIILELDNIKHALIFIRLHCLYLHMLEN